MKKWQEENRKQRAVLCIAVEGDQSSGAMIGYSALLIAALNVAMRDNPDLEKIYNEVLAVNNNPIARLLLTETLKKLRQKV